MIPKISHSDVDAYKLCKRKTYYGGTLGLERKATSDSLSRGILYHRIAEMYFKQGYDSALEYIQRALLEADPEIVIEVKSLFDYFIKSKVLEGWEILEVEKKYALPFNYKGTQLLYPFTVDLLARDTDGKIVLLDHKTTYRFYTQNQIDLNSQLPKYMGALRMLGIPVDYCAYIQLNYRAKKDKTVDDVVKFSPFTPSELRIETCLREQLQTAGKVYKFQNKPIEEQNELAVRTANNLVCNSCSFADLCISDLNGYDTNLLIQAKYQEREDRYAEFNEPEGA